MKESYKDSVLGKIPLEWNAIPIYELRNKDDRYSFTGGPFGSDLKSEHYTNEGVKIIQLQNIGEGKYIDKGFIYTSEEKANELSSCNIFPGDIILAKMAPVARCCKVPNTDNRFVMCSDGIRLAVDHKLYDNEYVFQALNAKSFRENAESKSTGTTRARIGLNDLKLIPVPIPPLPEQKKIASILSTADQKIEVIDQQIAQTQELKKGLMQKLLTKGIGHTKFKDSKLGEIPESWEVVKILNFAPLQRGFDLPTKNLCTGVYPVVYSNGINNYHNEYKVKAPGVVTGRSGTIGKVTFVEDDYWPHNTSLWVTDFHSHDPLFVYYFYLDFKLERFNAGTGVPTLNRNDVHRETIAVPPKEEQKKIASILSTVDDKIEVLQDKKAEYLELKKGLMQVLLTGKIRVRT